jgi:transposase
MALRLRSLAEEERVALERLAHSRTEPVRLVERARIVWYASQGERAPQIAKRLGLDPRTVRTWLNRFNEQGLPGLADQPRSGRPVTYAPEIVAEVLATSLTAPKHLGQPFGCWSIRRLETYLNEERGIPIKRNRIDELLLAEGLRWRTQESWFGERAAADFADGSGSEAATPRRLDPEFAAKRGRAQRAPRGFTPARRKGV